MAVTRPERFSLLLNELMRDGAEGFPPIFQCFGSCERWKMGGQKKYQLKRENIQKLNWKQKGGEKNRRAEGRAENNEKQRVRLYKLFFFFL